jgi:hypothetical protein
MENVRFTEQGVQIEGRAEFLDSLYTEKIQSFQVSMERIHRYKIVTIH